MRKAQLRTGLALVALVILLPTLYRFHVFTPMKERPLYVGLCDKRLHGNHRTGNHLFMLSAVLDLAFKTGRKIIMPKKGWFLDNIFDFSETNRHLGEHDITIDRYNTRNETCPCEIVKTPHYGYDQRFSQDQFLNGYSRKEINNSFITLEICGLSQTYVHAMNPEVNLKLRQLIVKLKDSSYNKADLIKNLLKAMVARNHLSSFSLYSYNGFNDSFTSYLPLKNYKYRSIESSEKEEQPFLVGVHVRMGDFLHISHVDYGLTVADDHYFKNAFDFFVKLHRKVLFVVLSDDIKWATEHLPDYFGIQTDPANVTLKNKTKYDNKDVKIIFFRDALAQDFALLCRSDSLIISTGTFGWWAAWFNSKAKVVYYDNYPRPNSSLASVLDKKHYYMKDWIPMI